MRQEPESQAGPEPDSPRSIEPSLSPDESSASLAGTLEETGRARPRRSSGRHYPSETLSLSTRDTDVMILFGKARIAAQYHVHARCFRGLSPVPVSRAVRRLYRLKLIDLFRWERVGINLGRLTQSGYDYLIDRGLARDNELHLAEQWLSPAHAAHTLAIVDVMVTFLNMPGNRTVLPCWAIRRKFGKRGAGMNVPDVIVAEHAEDGSWARLLAVEIDLGHERLGRLLLPRTEALRQHVDQWSDGKGKILVLARGSRRADAIRCRLPQPGIPVEVVVLPRLTGHEALDWLENLLSRGHHHGGGIGME